MRSRLKNFALGLLLVSVGLLASFAVAAMAPAGTTDTTDSTSTSTTTTTSTSTSTTTSTSTSTTPTTTTEFVIPSGVTIGHVSVAGMSIGMARATVQSFFSRPLALTVGNKRLRLNPKTVGASANIKRAMLRAEASLPGEHIALSISVDNKRLNAYVRSLGKRFDHPAVDARVFLRHLRPYIAEGTRGQQLGATTAKNLIRAAFKSNHRFAINLPLKFISRQLTEKNIGPVIVIRRGSNRLYLYNGNRFVRRFPVATGQAIYPTPLGRFQIVVKWENPWWYPPNSPWAAGEKPVPPGPGNPLGTRWMGLSAPGVGIHGTPESGSIGYSLSHGCIRMYIPDAEWLFNHVRVGTPVFIIPQ